MWRPRTRGVLQSSVLSGVAASCGLLAEGLPPDMRQSCQCFLAGWRVAAMEGGLFSQMSWLCVCCDFWHAGALGAGPERGAWRRAREATIHGVVGVDDLFSKSVCKHPPCRGIEGR